MNNHEFGMERHPIHSKNVALGVTGGIAAYKSADLASRLVKLGASVDVIMTAEARQFVAPLTFQAVTHRPVITDMFQLLEQTDIGHVSLAYRSDIVIVAPATAHTIARMASGLADDMLTATVLATKAPILLAPAMETGMWDNPLTQRNLETLRERGMTIVGPGEGHLASGRSGVGRMAEPAEIVDSATLILARNGDLAGYRILVTAGGTHEPIDPVRYIGNRSSGKMGYALAEAARNRGANVTLVSTPTALPAPYGVTVLPVETARDMLAVVLDCLPAIDVLIMAAAVADFRPEDAAGHKLKKEGREELVLRLVANPDILSEVAVRRGDSARPVVIGFAAETQDLVANAQAKLEKKRLDLIVANDVSAPGSGFGADTNQVILLAPGRDPEPLPLQSKVAVAHAVLDRLAGLLPG